MVVNGRHTWKRYGAAFKCVKCTLIKTIIRSSWGNSGNSASIYKVEEGWTSLRPVCPSPLERRVQEYIRKELGYVTF